MSEFSHSIKDLVKKGIEAISSSAENLASTTRQKVAEYNLVNEKEDIFQEIGSKVFELWKKGTEFPGCLDESLKKAAEKEDALIALHGKDSPEYGENESTVSDESVYTDLPVPDMVQDNAETFTISDESAAKDHRDVPVIEVNEDTAENTNKEVNDECPLSSAINDLFEKMPPVDKMVNRVNSSLDDLGESLKKFSGDFDRQLSKFTDQMMNINDQDPTKKT